MMPLGNFFSQRFRVPTFVLGGTREPGIKLLFHFIVELDSEDSAATAFDLIADLVIEPVEVRIVKGFFGFLESVVGG
jgi:hypothetical protein